MILVVLTNKSSPSRHILHHTGRPILRALCLVPNCYISYSLWFCLSRVLMKRLQTLQGVHTLLEGACKIRRL